MAVTIIEVNADNVEEYGFFCVKNKKHAGYPAKAAWLAERFREGLKIQLLHSTEGKPLGFIEYTPSEYAWRGVHLSEYLFIHCIYVSSRKDREQGQASRLLQRCIDDARQNNKKGVVMLTSDGGWLASQDIFVKNGFQVADTLPHGYQLMVYRLDKSPLPKFAADRKQRLQPYQEGFYLLYANQCPFHRQSVKAIEEVAQQYGYLVKVIELTSAADAQQAPSPFGVFNLIYNGQLIAEHYISATRFRNILTKELKLG